jgi:RHS repeat-associated protein
MLTTSSDIDALYVWDGLGNPVGLLTDYASNAFSYTYDPYGVQVLTAGGTGGGTSQNPYSFKAGIQDRASGLVKFGIRWYNPTTGTWTQQDTLDTPLDPHNANRYAYAANDPINNVDPSGKVTGAQFACGVAVVGVAAIFGALLTVTVTGIAAGVVAVGVAAEIGGVAGQVAGIATGVGGILAC